MAIMLSCSSCHGLTPDGASATCLHCDATLRVPPRWARNLAWVFGPVGAVLLAACYGPSGRYRNAYTVDRDHDGAFVGLDCKTMKDPKACEYEVKALGPNADCDDNDPKRFPGAMDPEGDKIDQDCDGVDGRGSAAGSAPNASDAGSGSGSAATH